MVFSKKKGEINLMYIFELVVVLFIVFLVFDAAWSFSEGKTTGKIITSKDLGFMVNSLLTVSGDAVVFYPKNISDYEVLLDDSAISVKERNYSEDVPIISSFILPVGFSATGVADSLYACLTKRDKSIRLINCEDIFSNISEIR